MLIALLNFIGDSSVILQDFQNHSGSCSLSSTMLMFLCGLELWWVSRSSLSVHSFKKTNKKNSSETQNGFKNSLLNNFSEPLLSVNAKFYECSPLSHQLLFALQWPWFSKKVKFFSSFFILKFEKNLTSFSLNCPILLHFIVCLSSLNLRFFFNRFLMFPFYLPFNSLFHTCFVCTLNSLVEKTWSLLFCLYFYCFLLFQSIIMILYNLTLSHLSYLWLDVPLLG